MYNTKWRMIAIPAMLTDGGSPLLTTGQLGGAAQEGGEGGEAPAQEAEGAQGAALVGQRQRRRARKQSSSLAPRSRPVHRTHLYQSTTATNRSAQFDFFITSIFAWTGFVKKLEPHKPRSRDLQTTRHG